MGFYRWVMQEGWGHSNALSRLSRTVYLPTKLVLMHTFVLSQFSFCSTVWHFCKYSDTMNIESVQYRALKYNVFMFLGFLPSLRYLKVPV